MPGERNERDPQVHIDMAPQHGGWRRGLRRITQLSLAVLDSDWPPMIVPPGMAIGYAARLRCQELRSTLAQPEAGRTQEERP
ncbi:MAG TPA: hypothetical protein VGS28_02850 [Candidatus Saccharimonadales bacterium]|nr:hypothetical protein [Candidatus Saccharimonadales bacterium]